jgi:hypothetical protein
MTDSTYKYIIVCQDSQCQYACKSNQMLDFCPVCEGDKLVIDVYRKPVDDSPFCDAT